MVPSVVNPGSEFFSPGSDYSACNPYASGPPLIRDERGKFRVLEDNVRVPSGVSYVLEHRGSPGAFIPIVVELTRTAAWDAGLPHGQAESG